VFILLDGERIKVVEGNTLWGISEKKLMQRHMDFYSLIEEVKDSPADDPTAVEKLKKARSLAFSKRHYELLEKMEKRI
jgi:Txe/YoeB family toxin of Txe-Axe toxin-antitoxin module